MNETRRCRSSIWSLWWIIWWYNWRIWVGRAERKKNPFELSMQLKRPSTQHHSRVEVCNNQRNFNWMRQKVTFFRCLVQSFLSHTPHACRHCRRRRHPMTANTTESVKDKVDGMKLKLTIRESTTMTGNFFISTLQTLFSLSVECWSFFRVNECKL